MIEESSPPTNLPRTGFTSAGESGADDVRMDVLDAAPLDTLHFSIVVPTRNEADDIEATCDALVRVRAPRKEIIVVDGASTDGTLNIVERYVRSHGFRLIREPVRRGVAAARNTGIRAATGNVVVLLNADVTPAEDFLERVREYYDAGYDYVAVESRVTNLESRFARFIQAQHELYYGGDRPVGWTEGFSCRRDRAIEAGLFPEELPGAGGEDGEFVERLRAAGARGMLNKSIVVTHVAPTGHRSFWAQWEGRGYSVPFLKRRVKKRPMPHVVLERVLASLWSIGWVLTVAPPLSLAVRLSRHSGRGSRDWPVFAYVSVVQVLAHRIGEWKGLAALVRERNSTRRHTDSQLNS